MSLCSPAVRNTGAGESSRRRLRSGDLERSRNGDNEPASRWPVLGSPRSDLPEGALCFLPWLRGGRGGRGGRLLEAGGRGVGVACEGVK